MSSTVTYKGATLTTATNQTRVLQTSGTWLEDDITIVDVTAASPTLQTKSKTYTPSTSQQTEQITADAGYDGLQEVDVTVNAISPTKSAETFYPSSSDQSVSSGRWLTGAQTFKAVTTTNLTAANIKSGITVEVGDSADPDRIASVTGTYTGGGAANFVSGTFTAQSAQGVQTINLSYSGSGYPVALMIWVNGGCYDSSNTTWYNSTARYTIGEYCMTKSVESSTPTYTTSGSQNQGVVCYIYKNSTSNSTTYQRSSTMTQNSYTSSDPGSQGSNCAVFKSKTSLAVYVRGSSNYGFMQGLTYKYLVLYSS